MKHKNDKYKDGDDFSGSDSEYLPSDSETLESSEETETESLCSSEESYDRQKRYKNKSDKIYDNILNTLNNIIEDMCDQYFSYNSQQDIEEDDMEDFPIIKTQIKFNDQIFIEPLMNTDTSSNEIKNKKMKVVPNSQQNEIKNKIMEKLDDIMKNHSLEDKIMNLKLNEDIIVNILYKYKTAESSDKAKMKSWVKTIIDLPLSNYSKVCTTGLEEFLYKAKTILDSDIYGMHNVKEDILDFIIKMYNNPDANGTILALEGPPGIGKCLAKDTPVLLYNGEIKMVQDITKMDILMGPDSTPRNIFSTTSGKELMYKITDNYSNETYTVNKSHILSLKNIYTKQIEDINVEVFYNLQDSEKFKYRGFRVPVSFENNENISYLELLGHFNEFKRQGIPIKYKTSSFQTRKHILNYYIKNIGYVSKYLEYAHIYTDSEVFVKDLLYIARSLGIKSKINSQKYNNNFELRLEHENWNKFMNISYENVYDISDMSLNYFISVEKLEEQEYYGFEINKDRRFVLGDFTVTHNTRICHSLSKILNLPFNQISMGGLHDASILTGFHETYVSAKPGRIVNILINSKCMNPIIYLDECFPYDQEIITENEESMEIGKLVELFNENKKTPLIKSYNLNTCSFEYKKITNAWEKKSDELLQLDFDNGSYIRCTKNHMFLTDLGYLEAKYLKSDVHRLVTDNGIIKVRDSFNMSVPNCKVYDIEIEDNHNFLVKNNFCSNVFGKESKNMVVHNCDKITFGEKATEVNGVLTHLLDEEQNKHFIDNYIEEIPIDLSKVLFIISYNDPEKLDPIVKNRMKVLKITPPTLSEKIDIVKNIMIPEYINKNFPKLENKIVFDKEIIKYIILNKTISEPGMRNIKKNVETVINKINTKMIIDSIENKEQKQTINANLNYSKMDLVKETDILKVTKELIDSILLKNNNYEDWMSMYQ